MLASLQVQVVVQRAPGKLATEFRIPAPMQCSVTILFFADVSPTLGPVTWFSTHFAVCGERWLSQIGSRCRPATRHRPEHRARAEQFRRHANTRRNSVVRNMCHRLASENYFGVTQPVWRKIAKSATKAEKRPHARRLPKISDHAAPSTASDRRTGSEAYPCGMARGLNPLPGYRGSR